MRVRGVEPPHADAETGPLLDLAGAVKSSEKRGRADGSSKPEKPAKKRKRTDSARTKQPELPRTRVRHLLDDADQICPSCGGKLCAKGDKVEASGRIHVTERVYTVVVDEKQVYGCGCGHTETALAPVQLVPGGRYDTSVAIQVAVDKFADHQPLNRQVSTTRRAGLRVSRQALWDQIKVFSVLLMCVYEAQHTWMINDHELLHADETTWRMMAKGARRNGGCGPSPLRTASSAWRCRHATPKQAVCRSGTTAARS